jgi:hypothetical protein
MNRLQARDRRIDVVVDRNDDGDERRRGRREANVLQMLTPSDRRGITGTFLAQAQDRERDVPNPRAVWTTRRNMVTARHPLDEVTAWNSWSRAASCLPTLRTAASR